MPTTPSERKQTERKRKQEQGLKRLEIWIYPELEEAIKKYVKRKNNSK